MMNILCFLMSNADNSVKTDEEIDKIELAIQELVDTIRLLHPNAGILPKLHILVAHLIDFMRTHKTWGRITEQSIEHLHGIFNKMERRFIAVRDPILRANLIIRQMTYLNLIHDIGDSWRAAD